MRKYGRWLLVLGVMAACPAFASADGFLTGRLKSPAAAGSAQQSRNQAMAEEVANALRDAKLNGYDVDIEVRDGVAVINGNVRDASHRALATSVVGRVPGILQVENNLKFVPVGAIDQASASASAARPEVTRASYAPDAFPGSQIRQVNSESAAPGAPAPGNQQVAEQIAAALSSRGLTGYDIEIRYSNGVASLAGNVATVQQRQAASEAVSQIPGVRSVNNQLQVNASIQQASFAPNGMPMGGYPGMPPGMMPGMMPPGQMGPGMAPGMGPSPMGMSPASYTNPHLPGHAWPAYAQYPNSAAVSYPTQYSASAWPYIGPFYPYPQVPMGWREVSLEWDDGYWQLNFNKEKDKWYWILSPKNW